MNVFFVAQRNGSTVVITPELTGTILPGITRDTTIQLLRDMGVPVEERRIGIDEVLTWHHAGRLLECFGTGTAATLSHIRRIQYRHEEILLPPVEERKIGPAVKDRLVAIIKGEAPDKHNWTYEVQPAQGPELTK
jgi:branched-chain amino acid aminotransferase